MSSFKGRVAIVTGAGAGLGRSHALGLAKAGAKVAVTDVSEAAARAVAGEIAAAGGEAIGLAADVADYAAVTRMVDAVRARWEAVDILVNNAGILRDRSFGKLEPADFDIVLKVHLTGSYNCARAVWNHMRERRYGRILFTSSASGIYGNFGQANYGAAKAGMIGLMNVLHIEGAKYDIRVNTLLPTAATQMTEGLIPEQIAAVLAPETVTPAVLYLVGEDAPARMIMGAGGGVYAVTHILETEGVYLPEADRTPETIAAHISRISDIATARPFDGAFEQTMRFATKAVRARGIDLPREETP